MARQADFLHPASQASQALSANRASSIAKNMASFLWRLPKNPTPKKPIGTNAMYSKASAASCQKQLLSLCPPGPSKLGRVSQVLARPTTTTTSPTNLNAIIIQAGMESYIWYLSCQPSLILFSIVIRMLTRPSMQAKGTQRPKSQAFLKVTVHPNDSTISSTIRMESEVACSSRQTTSKNPCSTPLPCAQTKYPRYLKRMEPKPTAMLILTLNFIQLSPYSSFSRLRSHSVPAPTTNSSGNSHPQLCSPEERWLSLLRMSKVSSILDYLPQPSSTKTLLQSRRTKLQLYSAGTSSCETTRVAQPLFGVSSNSNTTSFYLFSSCYGGVNEWILHLLWTARCQMDSGMATSQRLYWALCLGVGRWSLSRALTDMWPGSRCRRSTKTQQPYLRKIWTPKPSAQRRVCAGRRKRKAVIAVMQRAWFNIAPRFILPIIIREALLLPFGALAPASMKFLNAVFSDVLSWITTIIMYAMLFPQPVTIIIIINRQICCMANLEPIRQVIQQPNNLIRLLVKELIFKLGLFGLAQSQIGDSDNTKSLVASLRQMIRELEASQGFKHDREVIIYPEIKRVDSLMDASLLQDNSSVDVRKIMQQLDLKLKTITQLNEKVNNLNQIISQKDCEIKTLEKKVKLLQCLQINPAIDILMDLQKTLKQDRQFKAISALELKIDHLAWLVERNDDRAQNVLRNANLSLREKYSQENSKMGKLNSSEQYSVQNSNIGNYSLQPIKPNERPFSRRSKKSRASETSISVYSQSGSKISQSNY